MCSLCDSKVYSRGWCQRHYQRWYHNGDPLYISRATPGEGTGDKRKKLPAPNHPKANSAGYVRRYILVVEQVLGRLLKDGELVHHADCDETNDRNDNLVVCQDQSYHILLHQRTRAFKATGNANYRKCSICKKWDLPGKNGMRVYPMRSGHSSKSYHGLCDAQVQRQRRRIRQAA